MMWVSFHSDFILSLHLQLTGKVGCHPHPPRNLRRERGLQRPRFLQLPQRGRSAAGCDCTLQLPGVIECKCVNVNRGVVEKQNTGSEKLPGMNFKKTKEGEKAPARSPVRSLSTFAS